MLAETIERLENGAATKQDIFNEVWQWFVVEKHEKSRNPETGYCQYNLPEKNTKCAAGIFLRDCKYDPSFDGMYGTLRQVLTAIGGGALSMYDYVSRIQKIHDGSDEEDFHESVQDGLIRFAENEALTIPTA